MKVAFWQRFDMLKNIGIEKKYPNISKETAIILIDLLDKYRPKNILEIGGCNGLSTFTLAFHTQIDTSKITTIEKDIIRKDEIMSNTYEFLDRINICIGNAIQIIPTLSDIYDFIFIDAMKREYLSYFLLLRENKLLKKDCIIAFDNVVKFKDKMINLYEYLDENKIEYDIKYTIDDGVMIIENPHVCT